MTMWKGSRTALAALAAFSALTLTAVGAEEKICPETLPRPVRKAIRKAFPEAKIRGAAKEVEDGKTAYEVEMTVEGRAVDAVFSARGKILEVEKEVAVEHLPRSVKKGLAAKYPGAKIVKAEAVTRGKDGPVRYEVAIKAEVVLNSEGKVVGDDDEDDDHEHGEADHHGHHAKGHEEHGKAAHHDHHAKGHKDAAKAGHKKDNDDEDDDHEEHARAAHHDHGGKGHKDAVKDGHKKEKGDRDDEDDDDDEDEDDDDR